MAAKKLKDIDVQNLYLLNMPTKLFLAALAIIAILVVGYFGLFRSQLETLADKENNEVKLKETYTKKSIEAASLNNLQAELKSIRSAFDVLLKQLPTDAEIPNLIQELHQAGSTNGLRLDSVMPQAPVHDGPIEKLPYEIAITGKYSQISQFARSVGELSRIITLESLKITQSAEDKNSKDGKGDLLTLSATATTYKARPAEEVAAEQKAAEEAAAASGDKPAEPAAEEAQK